MDVLDKVLEDCLKEKTSKEIYEYVVKKIKYKGVNRRKRKEIVCRPVLMISESSDNEN